MPGPPGRHRRGRHHRPGAITCSTSAPGATWSKYLGHGATLFLLGGEPFEDDIVMWWNFVGRSHEDIVEARGAVGGGVDRASVGSSTTATSGSPAPPLPARAADPRRRRSEHPAPVKRRDAEDVAASSARDAFNLARVPWAEETTQMRTHEACQYAVPVPPAKTRLTTRVLLIVRRDRRRDGLVGWHRRLASPPVVLATAADPLRPRARRRTCCRASSRRSSSAFRGSRSSTHVDRRSRRRAPSAPQWAPSVHRHRAALRRHPGARRRPRRATASGARGASSSRRS